MDLPEVNNPSLLDLIGPQLWAIKPGSLHVKQVKLINGLIHLYMEDQEISYMSLNPASPTFFEDLEKHLKGEWK